LGFDYSGSLAVKFFFFLSGLLVTESILNKPSPLKFLARRCFRIFPGLWVCIATTVFVVGPALTQLQLGEYLYHAEVRGYLFHNVSLIGLRWTLPGVIFAPLPAINGSLWTLPFECLCYIFLAVGSSLGLFLSRGVASGFLCGVIGMSLLAPEYTIQFGSNPEAQLLPACFALGGLAALHKNTIRIGPEQGLALWVLVWLIPYPLAHKFLFYVAAFYSVTYIASLGWVCRYMRIPFDASYGVYIYGFVVQQVLHKFFPEMGVHMHQLSACFVALCLGTLSWYIVEKPSIEAGARLTRPSNG
jgi:peptidoglycan/LPS O-acetylase OafA/YrhL